jgi:hypothetical protein
MRPKSVAGAGPLQDQISRSLESFGPPVGSFAPTIIKNDLEPPIPPDMSAQIGHGCRSPCRLGWSKRRSPCRSDWSKHGSPAWGDRQVRCPAAGDWQVQSGPARRAGCRPPAAASAGHRCPAGRAAAAAAHRGGPSGPPPRADPAPGSAGRRPRRCRRRRPGPASRFAQRPRSAPASRRELRGARTPLGDVATSSLPARVTVTTPPKSNKMQVRYAIALDAVTRPAVTAAASAWWSRSFWSA